MAKWCPGCGASLAEARGKCLTCGGETTGVQFGMFVRGSRFVMPARCSCCLVETRRTSRQDNGSQTYNVALEVPTCAGCSTISALTAVVRFLGWTVGFLIAVVVAGKYTTGATAAYNIVLFGGFATLVAASYLATRWAPPFRRRGHTLRCRSVKVYAEGATFHNHHFAKLTTGRPPADADASPTAALLARAAKLLAEG